MSIFNTAQFTSCRLAPTCLLLGTLLLSACTSRAPLPEQTPDLALPMQLHIQRLQADQRLDWVLVIQREGPGIRWSMMDLLGIPQARQKLVDGAWHADGLLPPNAEARELFAALLFALTPGINCKATIRPPGNTVRNGHCPSVGTCATRNRKTSI